MSQPAPRDNRSAGTMLPLASPPPVVPTPTGEPPSAFRRRPLWLVLLSVLGPGVIAAAAGNDAGGIATYSQAGAKYGLSLLWSIAVVTIGLIVVQEMCARMGAVTGKGLAALIRENFGVKVTFFAMLVLLVANFATTVSEFAGIAAVGEMFLGPRARYYVLPAAIVLVWLLVSRGSYQKVERILLVASGIFATYIITAFRLKGGIPWKDVALNTFAPHLSALPWRDSGLILMVVSLIGTTIAPYMQFYQQSAVRDKGVTMRDYGLTRWDTVIGCVLSNVVAVFIIVVCAQTIGRHGGMDISTADQAAQALKPFAGIFAKYLFAFGLLNASLMAAVIVPLSTAYAVTESLGWESGMGRRIRELPLFYGTYGALILCSGLVILLSSSNLISIIIQAQVINCALLPIELVLMLVLINRRRVMGKYRNRVWDNIVAWATTVIAGGLALYYFAQQLLSLLHPSHLG